MLLRNLDQVEGLSNRTRLTFTRLANHVIEAKIITRKKYWKQSIHFENVIVTFAITMAVQACAEVVSNHCIVCDDN